MEIEAITKIAQQLLPIIVYTCVPPLFALLCWS